MSSHSCKAFGFCEWDAGFICLAAFVQ